MLILTIDFLITCIQMICSVTKAKLLGIWIFFWNLWRKPHSAFMLCKIRDFYYYYYHMGMGDYQTIDGRGILRKIKNKQAKT